MASEHDGEFVLGGEDQNPESGSLDSNLQRGSPTETIAEIRARIQREAGSPLTPNDLGPITGNIWKAVQGEALEQAAMLDWSQAMYDNVIATSASKVTNWINEYLSSTRQFGGDLLGYFNSAEGFDLLFDLAWNQFATINRDFSERGSAVVRGGGRGGGSRGPTAQDIRNSFDLNALAQSANQIWRDMLYTTPKDANAIASAYVDIIVESMGEKAVDFRSFVRSKAMETGRFAVIYKDKPEGQAPEEFLQQFTAPSENVLRGENVESVALGGARLGSDSSTFQARLARSNEIVTSAPFINNLEGRMQGLSEVLKG